MEKMIEQLRLELGIQEKQVRNTIGLIDEGNTIPFIARYRKEVTGNLDDEILRKFKDRLDYLRNLEHRKEEVIRLIEDTGNLTEELVEKINKATILTEVEDIYRPFKPKKRTKATMAKEKGLEPLAKQMIAQKEKTGDVLEIAKSYINEEKGVATAEEALQGACDIIAEDISDVAEYRKQIRRISYRTGKIETTAVKEEPSVYDMYYHFAEPVNKIPSHRILAIQRGEKEGFLKVKLEVDEEEIEQYIAKQIIKGNSIYESLLQSTIQDSYKRLIKPSIEREIRSDKFEEASEQAIKVFGVNIKNLLMGAPLKGMTIMGFDPAYRTGCKIAIIDETGKLLDYTTVYPTEPQNDVAGATKTLLALIEKDKVDMIAIGNGTASRESEKFVADLIKQTKDRKSVV